MTGQNDTKTAPSVALALAFNGARASKRVPHEIDAMAGVVWGGVGNFVFGLGGRRLCPIACLPAVGGCDPHQPGGRS